MTRQKSLDTDDDGSGQNEGRRPNQVRIRIPDALREKVEDAAGDRPVNAEYVRRLQRSFELEDRALELGNEVYSLTEENERLASELLEMKSQRRLSEQNHLATFQRLSQEIASMRRSLEEHFQHLRTTEDEELRRIVKYLNDDALGAAQRASQPSASSSDRVRALPAASPPTPGVGSNGTVADLRSAIDARTTAVVKLALVQAGLRGDEIMAILSDVAEGRALDRDAGEQEQLF